MKLGPLLCCRKARRTQIVPQNIFHGVGFVVQRVGRGWGGVWNPVLDKHGIRCQIWLRAEDAFGASDASFQGASPNQIVPLRYH